LPVGNCIELLQVDALAIPDVAQIRKTSVDETQLPHPAVSKEVRVSGAGVAVVGVLGVFVFSLVLPDLLVMGNVNFELLFAKPLEILFRPKLRY
jgi:hypothetical protein